MSALRLHRIIPVSRAEGPGSRFVIWVQGCSIRCPDCAVPWTWNADGGFSRSVESLAEEILATPDIEGLTVLGGEPFDQAAPLAELASRLRPSGLSVMIFTGYELDFLQRSGREDWNALLARTDLLVDGPFIASKASTERPWIGSSNQRFRFLTDRYADRRERLSEHPNRIEIRLSPDGRLSLNGMASPELWNDLVRWLHDPFGG